jgi:hypothetical protein
MNSLLIRSVVILSMASVFLATFFPARSDDLFMYLTLGQKLLSGQLPTVDPYLFSMPDHHWHLSHEWGTCCRRHPAI